MGEFELFPIEKYRPQYLSGLPIDTPYGKIRFMTLKEQIEYGSEIQLMSMNILHIYYELKKQYEKAGQSDAIPDEFKDIPLHEYVTSEYGMQFLEAYYTVFNLLFEDIEMVETILKDEASFMDVRNIVCDMNLIKEDKVSRNPEIQKGYEESRMFKKLEKGEVTIEDMLSSIVVAQGWDYERLYSNTIYQIYMTFARISQFKDFETTRLFATIPTDKKVSIEPWNKHITLFDEEQIGMKMSEFNEKFGNLMKV